MFRGVREETVLHEKEELDLLLERTCHVTGKQIPGRSVHSKAGERPPRAFRRRTQPAGGRRERSRAQIPHGAAVTGATGAEFSGKIRVPILVLHKAVLYVKGVIVKNAMNSS